MSAAPNLPVLLNDAETIPRAFQIYFQTVLGDGITVYTDFDYKKDAQGNPVLDSAGNLQALDLSDRCVIVSYLNQGATGHYQTPNVTGTGAPQGEEDWFAGSLSVQIQIYRPDNKPSTLANIVRSICQYRAQLRAAMLLGVLSQVPPPSGLDLGYYGLTLPFSFTGEKRGLIENLGVDLLQLEWRITTFIQPDAWPAS